MAEDPSVLSLLPQQQQSQICSCSTFPDFATVCIFIEQFGEILGLHTLNINNLKEAFEDYSEEVPDLIQGLHVYLLRRLRKNVPGDRWERELIKFCSTYSQWHSWELERWGYSKLKLQFRLAIIRNLLEAQFDGNVKFQERIRAEIPEEELRKQCYGRDKHGLCYWFIQDEVLTVNVYQVEQDDTDGASWHIVARDREELETLIECLKEDKTLPGQSLLPTRSNTPLSVLSGVGALSQSYSATPTKFALDRLTPVKCQSPMATSVCGDGEVKQEPEVAGNKMEVAESKSIKLEETEPLVNETEEAETNQAEAETNQAEAETKQEEVETKEKAEIDKEGKETTQGETTGCEPSEEKTTGPIAVKDGVKSTEQTNEDSSMAGDGLGREVQPAMDSTENKSEDCEGDLRQMPFTNMMNDTHSTPAASDIAVGEEINGSHPSTDSEDNIPLSQLRQSCVLLSKARRSLLKAKKQHEKKKMKELVKKKKEKIKKSFKAFDAGNDSLSSSFRSSSRQRKPVMANLEVELEAEESSSEEPLSDDEYIPKQGRNARRQAKRSGAVVVVPHETLSSEVDNDDTPCFSCGKYNQPHLLLLCDSCDAAWHTGCVRPPLFYIPEGDWHCPNCEHNMLVEKLQADLEKLDGLIKAKEARQKKMERQEKYALSNGIHPSNIITDFNSSADKPVRERKNNKRDEYAYDSADDYIELPIKRSCRPRTKVNYTFEQYEAVMKNAISRNADGEADPTILSGVNSSLVRNALPPKVAKPPGKSRGKDIGNLLDGTNLSVTSDEEQDEETQPSVAKETQARRPTRTQSSAARKKSNRFNDMDADSAGETDDDYSMSDDANDDYEGKSGVSEDSLSDDNWRPPRGSKKGGRRQRSSRRREDVLDFICDDEESETDKPKPKRMSLRRPAKSASATQAALRAKRAKFGFTSSEESVATTPCSSSTEEEEHVAKRRLNKWNKTYSSHSNKQSSAKKKKKQFVKKSYNSDQSTEQESSESGDEYLPPGDQDKQTDEGEAEGSDAGEGVRRIKNRLESSSDECDKTEADNRESVTKSDKLVNESQPQAGDIDQPLPNGTAHSLISTNDSPSVNTQPTTDIPASSTNTSSAAIDTLAASAVCAVANTNVAPPMETAAGKAVVIPPNSTVASTAPQIRANDRVTANNKELGEPVKGVGVVPASIPSRPSQASLVPGYPTIPPNANNNNSGRFVAPPPTMVTRPRAAYSMEPAYAQPPPSSQTLYRPYGYGSYQQTVGNSSMQAKPFYQQLPAQFAAQSNASYQPPGYTPTVDNSYQTSFPPHQQGLTAGGFGIALPPLSSNQPSSNAFMVDSLLQSDSSQKTGSYGGGMSGAPMPMADDDDEMSSYMAMASSFVAGRNTNS